MTEPSRLPGAGSIIVSVHDLLHFTGCADIEELSAQVYDDFDVDTWVGTYADGVEVRTTACAIGIPFPFTLAEFRDVLAEVEADYLRRCGDERAAREAV
jgi:hypothetical protein